MLVFLKNDVEHMLILKIGKKVKPPLGFEPASLDSKVSKASGIIMLPSMGYKRSVLNCGALSSDNVNDISWCVCHQYRHTYILGAMHVEQQFLYHYVCNNLVKQCPMLSEYK